MRRWRPLLTLQSALLAVNFGPFEQGTPALVLGGAGAGLGDHRVQFGQGAGVILQAGDDAGVAAQHAQIAPLQRAGRAVGGEALAGPMISRARQ